MKNFKSSGVFFGMSIEFLFIMHSRSLVMKSENRFLYIKFQKWENVTKLKYNKNIKIPFFVLCTTDNSVQVQKSLQRQYNDIFVVD